MFAGAALFNSSLADWDTARVVDVHAMYVLCHRCMRRGLPTCSRPGLAGRKCT